MRRTASALLLTALLGCHDEPTTSEQTEPLGSAVPANQCNDGSTFQPPLFSLDDINTILTRVLFYEQSDTNFQLLFDGSWTNWYKLDMGTGLAKLATMRSKLDEYNLSDTYIAGTRPQVDCTGKTAVRQADGSCNDLVETMAGAATVRIGRNIPVFQHGTTTPNPYSYPPADADILTPNPRTISRQLFTRDANGMKPVPFLNLLAAAWIQFMVHDWFSHGDNDPNNFFYVPLAADDPLTAQYNITQLVIPKTTRDLSAIGQPLPPVYKNEVTHWWDASQLYGSSVSAVNALRARDVLGNLKAELAMDATGLLPTLSDGFEQTGFRRNWWIGLGLMHNLFAQEHNSIVAMLRSSHPEFSEQALFDHARMINAAVIAKIHTVEWTPAILPNQTATVGLHANWYGLQEFLDPASQGALPTFMSAMDQTIAASSPDPDTAQERIIAAHAAVNGVRGGPTDNHGIPYSMTEEFVSVYRMHALLPDTVEIRSATLGTTLRFYDTAQTRNSGARGIEEKYGLANVIYSFGVEHPGALVLNNYPGFIQQLQLPSGVTDMGTIDILRDRERGIPRYNDFREQVQLKRVGSIEELTPDPALQAALHNVYGADVGAIDRIDMLVGTMAEGTRPACYGFGETLFQIFIEMATRRLMADRFYTRDYTAATYTQEGLDWITNASFKNVILRHYPQLASTGLAVVNNAFYPWQ